MGYLVDVKSEKYRGEWESLPHTNGACHITSDNPLAHLTCPSITSCQANFECMERERKKEKRKKEEKKKKHECIERERKNERKKNERNMNVF